MEKKEFKKDFKKSFNKDYRKDYRKPLKVGGVNQLKEKFPEHIINLALLVKNNAEIRRFTAIGIINHLKKIGVITAEKNHISFKWNKFAVISNGLTSEYLYSEPFFIKALIASFTNFSASAQRIINQFLFIEENDDISSIKEDEISEIVNSNEQYVIQKNNDIEVVEE